METQCSFNTTFVTVLCLNGRKARSSYMFQYNFCYCSIYWSLRGMDSRYSFNTTFVTVLSFYNSYIKPYGGGFNTTFVTVLSKAPTVNRNLIDSFNTTFVTVLLTRSLSPTSASTVSIQLLLLFYKEFFADQQLLMEFQYNFCYCSIQTEWELHFLK